jgi:hypothetical protein
VRGDCRFHTHTQFPFSFAAPKEGGAEDLAAMLVSQPVWDEGALRFLRANC